MGRRALTCALAAALAVPAAGCSFLFVSPMPKDPRARVGHGCASRALPTLDAGLAVAGMLVLMNAAFNESVRTVDLAVGVPALTLGLLSTAYGSGTIAECGRREARQQRVDERRARRERFAAQVAAEAESDDDDDDDDEEEDDDDEEASSPDGGAPDGAGVEVTPVIRPAPPAVEIRPAPPATPRP